MGGIPVHDTAIPLVAGNQIIRFQVPRKDEQEQENERAQPPAHRPCFDAAESERGCDRISMAVTVPSQSTARSRPFWLTPKAPHCKSHRIPPQQWAQASQHLATR